MNEGDILDVLRDALNTPPEGPEGAYTTDELSEATGMHIRPLRELLKTLLKKGEAEVVRVRRTAIDGRNALVPAYRIRSFPAP